MFQGDYYELASILINRSSDFRCFTKSPFPACVWEWSVFLEFPGHMDQWQTQRGFTRTPLPAPPPPKYPIKNIL